MLKTEEWLMLRDLNSQGLNVSEISRQTGYDRKTVKKYLDLTTVPQAQKRQRKASKLDPYKPYIHEKLNSGPYTASRLFREIKDQGFDGGYTIVKDYVRDVRPKQAVPAVLRYETKPGVQSQVDWAEMASIEVEEKTLRIYCFNMILGYSRMRYIEFTLSMDTATLIQCHINAFQYFGGCTQEILYDNMKQVVIKRALKASNSQWNSQFEDFFKHYGFIPRLCRPYRPQTKGKIENTVGYVKRDLFLGIDFVSMNDLNEQAMKWLERVNSTVHGTTHEIPLERFKIEELVPLNQHPYRMIRKEKRKVSRDCYVSYLGNKYSVPYRFAGRNSEIHVDGGKLQVYIDNEQVCKHEIIPGNSRVVRNKEHFAGLLSEILKQNSQCRKTPQIPISMSDVEVEKRSLDVYDAFCEEGSA
ncbi:MAG: IS21 family transposase [Methanosarcinaceae archaeon]|nr:IS21 family transposase [Methanosarcinaceae archaeon]